MPWLVSWGGGASYDDSLLPLRLHLDELAAFTKTQLLDARCWIVSGRDRNRKGWCYVRNDLFGKHRTNLDPDSLELVWTAVKPKTPQDTKQGII